MKQQIGLGCASCYALYTIPHPKTFDMNLWLPSQQKLSCELVQLGKFVFKGSLMTPNKQLRTLISYLLDPIESIDFS